jgi:4-diphosphocytidyl-2C-methyl-D-erythritol kinase
LPEKTARLYARVTPAQYSDGGITRRMIQNLLEGNFVVEFVHNSFESVALQAFPELEPVYLQLARQSRVTPHLAGSGPALFCLPSSEAEHARLREVLQPYAVEAYLVHTISPRISDIINLGDDSGNSGSGER